MNDLLQLRLWIEELLATLVTWWEQEFEGNLPSQDALNAYGAWRVSPDGLAGLHGEGYANDQLSPVLHSLLSVRQRAEAKAALRKLDPRLNDPTDIQLPREVEALRTLQTLLDALLQGQPAATASLPATNAPPTPAISQPGSVDWDDVVTRLHVAGLRCLEDVTLDTGGLTVLIGENGAGKSSLVEACELLSRVPHKDFAAYLDRAHGGLAALMRQGARDLVLEIETDGTHRPMRYKLVLSLRDDNYWSVTDERLDLRVASSSDEPLHVIQRIGAQARVFDQLNGRLVDVSARPDEPLLANSGLLPQNQAIRRMVSVLERIDVQVPFNVQSHWVASGLEAQPRARRPNHLRRTERLERFADNLSNAYFHLRNDKTAWPETLDLVRLGLGWDVDLSLDVPPGGGAVALQLQHRLMPRPIPLSGLSDGMMCFLAFVALARLPVQHSLLVFDEPEVHLNPALLIRVLDLFESMAETRPVLLCTHSDRLLDALREPAAAVVLMELAPGVKTRLLRPDPEELAHWLTVYKGIGDMRAQGQERLVMKAWPPHER